MNLLPEKIGFRYSYARRGSNFIGLNAILAIIGISIGIAALIVVLSVMNGVVSEVRDRLLGMSAQVSLRSYESTGMIAPSFNPKDVLAQVPDVKAYAPYVQGQGLVGDGRAFQGILMQGVDPNQEGNVSSTFAALPKNVQAGLSSGSFNIVLGKGLANTLGLDTGSKITIIVPQMTASAAGILPRLKRFTVIGTFDSGHYQYDNSMVIINLDDARTLLQLPEGVTGYHLKIDDAMQAPHIRDRIQPLLPFGVYASDWSRDQAAYFGAVQTEKNAMFIILCLIIIVAAFGLLSSMYMVVTEKRRDIAILRTMGIKRAEIRRIFLMQGMMFGGLGTLIGVTLGIIISLNVPALMRLLEKMSGFKLPAQQYFISQLSAKIDPAVVIGVVMVTLVLTLLFSVIPAQIAAKTEPARALSHE